MNAKGLMDGGSGEDRADSREKESGYGYLVTSRTNKIREEAREKSNKSGAEKIQEESPVFYATISNAIKTSEGVEKHAESTKARFESMKELRNSDGSLMYNPQDIEQKTKFLEFVDEQCEDCIGNMKAILASGTTSSFSYVSGFSVSEPEPLVNEKEKDGAAQGADFEQQVSNINTDFKQPDFSLEIQGDMNQAVQVQAFAMSSQSAISNEMQKVQPAGVQIEKMKEIGHGVIVAQSAQAMPKEVEMKLSVAERVLAEKMQKIAEIQAKNNVTTERSAVVISQGQKKEQVQDLAQARSEMQNKSSERIGQKAMQPVMGREKEKTAVRGVVVRAKTAQAGAVLSKETQPRTMQSKDDARERHIAEMQAKVSEMVSKKEVTLVKKDEAVSKQKKAYEGAVEAKKSVSEARKLTKEEKTAIRKASGRKIKEKTEEKAKRVKLNPQNAKQNTNQNSGGAKRVSMNTGGRSVSIGGRGSGRGAA